MRRCQTPDFTAFRVWCLVLCPRTVNAWVSVTRRRTALHLFFLNGCKAIPASSPKNGQPSPQGFDPVWAVALKTPFSRIKAHAMRFPAPGASKTNALTITLLPWANPMAAASQHIAEPRSATPWGRSARRGHLSHDRGGQYAARGWWG